MLNMNDGDLLYCYEKKSLGMIIDARICIFAAGKSKRYQMIWFDEMQPYWEWQENILRYRLDYLKYLKENAVEIDGRERKK